jgi:T-complex protein 1 subunit epsilon
VFSILNLFAVSLLTIIWHFKLTDHVALSLSENDVALQKIDVSKIAELIAELSQSEEYGPMDGTSGVLALTQSLITQVQKHFRDGTAVINILEYYDVASKIACDHLDHISEDITFSATDKQPLTRTCTAVLSTSDAIKG